MLSIKLEGIEQAMRMFDPKVVSPAASQAINDAARAGRAEAARALLGKWNLKAGKVNAELKNIKFARIGDLTATIQAKGRPISLQYFGFKEVRRTVKGKGGKYRQVKGVTGSVLKAGGGKSYPGAFTATMLSGHNGVFMTEKRFFGLSDYGYNKPTRGRYAGQRGRTPVVSMSTVTIATMFNQVPVQQATVNAVEARFQSRFGHHIDRLMDK
ncbi:phage tail protein [Syntrophotalea acetylenica]|uniref:Prophage minor tail protein Z (GPZ) n=1 Tax=Syntrophotalea acetylenica TaxID=29542 RepID=A0A1L3GDU1_SYNAC|nr:phage tail protein [Syntrophotalea acetylenica]APG24077.1 hypothetical protein A7E75_02815 [Syntrophotalea acetylenica]APG44659.1 hypothetical protein A6070_11440 [Syntrophotalea acetylenica]